MAYGRKRTRPARRRRYVRKQRAYRKRAGKYIRFPRAPKSYNFAPLGTVQTANLRYCDNITIDCSAGVSGDYVFSANGLYDPNITGTGHQPYGFDQMMNFFNHYTCTGSRCVVRAASTVAAPFYVGIALRDDNIPLLGVSLQTLMEQSGIVFKISNYGDSTRPVVVSRGFSMRKFFRGSKLGDKEYSGDAANNPGDQAYFHVVVVPAAGEDLAAQRLLLQIDYHTIFTEMRPLSTS